MIYKPPARTKYEAEKQGYREKRNVKAGSDMTVSCSTIDIARRSFGKAQGVVSKQNQ